MFSNRKKNTEYIKYVVLAYNSDETLIDFHVDNFRQFLDQQNETLNQ